MVGDISKSSKIRIGIKSFIRQSVFILFAEENSTDTKGINFCWNGYGGNQYNFPGYKAKNNKWSDLGKDYHHVENTVPPQQIKWFEFEWNLEEGEMKASKIDNEKGGGKQQMSKWSMNNMKLNYLMFTTGWNNRATATTYIINGEPTEEDILNHFDQK